MSGENGSTMKKLYIVRHAKASWDSATVSDFDRELTDAGKQQAFHIGLKLKKSELHPDLLITSPAERAVTTAELIAHEIEYPFNRIQTTDTIYSGDAHAILEMIQSFDDKLQLVMLIGHNPVLCQLCHYIAPSQHNDLPPATIYAVEFDVDSWKDVNKEKGKCFLFEES